jgi:hypothetical protein
MIFSYQVCFFVPVEFLYSASSVFRSQDSSVGIATGCGLDGPVSFPAIQDFSFHSVQNDSGAHPASCVMSTGSSFPEGKAAGA